MYTKIHWPATEYHKSYPENVQKYCQTLEKAIGLVDEAERRRGQSRAAIINLLPDTGITHNKSRLELFGLMFNASLSFDYDTRDEASFALVGISTLDEMIESAANALTYVDGFLALHKAVYSDAFCVRFVDALRNAPLRTDIDKHWQRMIDEEDIRLDALDDLDLDPEIIDLKNKIDEEQTKAELEQRLMAERRTRRIYQKARQKGDA